MTKAFGYGIIFKRDWYAPVAQPVEHLTFNQGVRDSNSRRSTKEGPVFAGPFAFYKSFTIKVNTFNLPLGRNLQRTFPFLLTFSFFSSLGRIPTMSVFKVSGIRLPPLAASCVMRCAQCNKNHSGACSENFPRIAIFPQEHQRRTCFCRSFCFL